MFGLLFALLTILIALSKAETFTTYPYPTESFFTIPIINSISTDITSTTEKSGSLSGGNTLYIRGTSLASDLRKVTVYIGGTVCPLDYAYTSDFQIACTVPPASQSGTVPVKVTSAGSQATCDSQVCQYTYSAQLTPRINYFAPPAVIGNDAFSIIGAWYGANPNQLQISLNGGFCPRYLSTLDADTTQCVPEGLPAGRYTINTNVPKFGIAKKTDSATVLANDDYSKSDFVIIPEITKLSSSTGPTSGQTITITGRGFSANNADNEVLYEGQHCDVTSSSYSTIKCTLTTPPFRTGGDSRPGHGGLTHRLYPQSTSFAALKKSYDYIIRNLVPVDSYGRLAAFEVESERPVLFQSEVLEGYFLAPKTGTYKFMLSASSFAELYISTTPLVETPVTKIATVNTASNFRDFYTEATQVSDDIVLTEGNYYFLQAYHITSHPNHLTVGVRIPNDAKTDFAPEEVVSVKINADVERFEATFTIQDSTEELKLSFADLESEIFVYPAASYEIEKAFLDLNIEAKVLSRTFLNSTDDEVAQENATKIQYHLRLYTQPTFVTLPLVSNDDIGLLVQVYGNSPTSLVTGSFELNFNGVTIPLNYDSTTADVQAAFDSALGQDFATRVFRNGRVEEGAEFIIYFDGVDHSTSTPAVTLKSSSITGGKTTPTVTVAVKQDDASTDIVLPVIPPQLLRTHETSAQITVKSNGLLASCKGNCKYGPAVGTNWPTITGYTRNGQTLTITFINADTKVAADFDKVLFGGNTATVSSYDATTQTLTCTISLNADSSARLVAGTHVPQVRVKSLGYALINYDVPTVTVTPTITAADPVELANGLVEVTIEGTGYGFSLTENFGAAVTIGGVTCSLTSMTNTKIVCRANIAITNGPLVLTVNKVTIQTAFTFKKALETQQITNNCDLDVTGTGFTDATVVMLINSDETVQEKCRACTRTSTLIKCNVCDLPNGEYTAVVNHGAASTTPLTGVFFTIDHSVNSISPTSGSLLGGTVLTITGAGFSTTLEDNEVTIGTEDAELVCEVLTATSTQITCKVPYNEADFDASTPTTVTVWKGDNKAVCTGTCTYTFSSSKTPTITNANLLTIKAGDSVSLQGTMFSATTKFTFDGLSAVVGSVTTSLVTVTVPAISANSAVEFTATDPTLGDFVIAGTVMFSSPLTLADVTPKTGSQGGSVLTLTGQGFSKNTVVKIGNARCTTLTFDLTKITCRSSPSSSGAITVAQNGYSGIICSGCSYTESTTVTPTVTGFTPATSGDTTTVTITGTQLDLGTPAVTLTFGTTTVSATISSSSATSIVAVFAGTPVGKYQFDVRSGDHFAVIANPTLTIPYDQVVASSVVSYTVSQAGDRSLELEFQGHPLPLEASALSVRVAGIDCPITGNTATSITCTIPPLALANAAPLATEGVIEGNVFGSSTSGDVVLAFDDSTTTSWEGASGSECFIGIDVGEGLRAKVNQIEFYPSTSIDPSKLQNGVFEGSVNVDDFTTIETTIVTVTDSVYQGWNVLHLDANAIAPYRYIRYRQAEATSRCEFAELRFKGTVVSALEDSDPSVVAISQVTVTANGNTNTAIVADIEYRQDATPTVTGITPKVGTSAGGTTVDIQGTNFPSATSDVKVTIDGVTCTVSTVNATHVTCVTGALPAIADRTERLTGEIKVVVEGKGQAVATGVKFLYAERWSQAATWGCDGIPIEGDSVYVPEGMNLLVDLSPPQLNAVVVLGGLFFEDKEINFGAEYILVRGGHLQIGTEAEPVTSKITITLYGDSQDNQMPIFGNKVIGAYEGTVDIHGTTRAALETTLATTSKIGDSHITVDDASGFKVGDYIVISTTSASPAENEKRKIIKLDGNKVYLDARLSYVHLAEQEAIPFAGATQTVQLKAVIVLLTRNVVIQGDDSSIAANYGVHLLFNDPQSGLTTVRISNVEIRNAGQAGYVDRYPVNFQNLGDQFNSYIKECAIHSTFNKGIQVRGTQYLKVSSNILYNIKGQAIVLTDGVERFNKIDKNTIIGVHEDVFPFSSVNNPKAVKIANPNNFITKNKIIGAPFGGFHLAYTATAQGAAYGQTVCPQGERLGSFADNSVLSTFGVGVTIDAHYPRTFACQAARTEDADPYAANPPVPATYRGLNVMRTDRGLVAQSVGAVIFDNFRIADTWAACINIMNVANAPLKSSKITNTLVVGRLKLTHGAINAVSSVGILVPESDGFTLDTVLFAHFSSSIPAIQTIHGSTSTTTFVKGLKFYDVQTQVSLYRHIIYDEDGSLTGSADSYVMYDFPHARVPECTNATISGVLVCDNSVEVRSLTFTNFPQKTLKILRLEEGVDPDTVASTHVTSLTYTAEQGVPFVTGYPYRASFGNYVELVGGVVKNSPLASEDDLPITLAFENTGTQIDFNVVRMTYPDTTANCSNSTAFDMYEKTGIADKWFGDFFNDFATTTLYIAVTGKDVQSVAAAEDVSTATINAFVGVPTDPSTNPGNNGTDNSTNGTNCTANGTIPCNSTGNSTNPTDPEDPTPQPVLGYRLWSNASGWPSGVKPAAGSNVIIDADDTVFLDENSASLNSLTINGQLILGLNESTAILTSKRILVRGRLEAGNETNPFTGSATIRLTGTSADPSLSINGAVATGPKVLAVTGELSLYGKAVTTLVRLTANAAAGATQITVDGDISGFVAGDELLISASGSTASQSEVKIIQSVNTDTKTITLTTGLSFFHYGSASTLEVSNGMTVDMRTEVLHMTRNIKIEGTQEGNIGARIMVTTETISGATKVGVINMKYVSLSYCGQIDTLRSALAFESTSGVSSASTVYGSVFRNSVAQVVSFRQASKVTFEQNVIYNAYQHGIRFYATNNDIKVLNNAIIGVTQASTATLVQSSAGILIVDATNTAIQIKNNIVAGCGFSCYFIRPPACSATSTYLNNVAHSGKFGYVGYSDRADCISIANFTAYRMEYGVISDTPVTRMEVKGLALLDNGVSLNIVNSGNGATVTSTKYPTIGYDGVRNVSIENCYFAGVALTTCAACYSQASTCSSRYAIGLNRFTDLVRDTTLTATRLNALGSRYSVSGNYFDNYSDGLVANCINNKVFLVSGQARDFIPYIKTAGNTIRNVNENALAWFQTPTTGDNNCGPNSECTLELNTLIEDNDGLLTASGTQPTMVLPNNTGVMNSSLCTAHSSINGYVCKGAKYGLLSFQVMDNDKYSTKLSPVVLNKTGFTSSVNSHRTNYATFASDTQKFISLIETEGTYNVYFPDQIPREVVYEMEGADGDYVLLKIPYPITKTVMITNLATGEKGASIMTKQTNAGVFESSDKCGAYSINNVTGEITAKITAGADCALIIEKRNSIVLRIRFTMPLADFFAKGLTNKFIAKIAQILNIASSRIRLVMLYSGSTGIIAAIDSETQGDDSRTAATTELQTAQTALTNALASNQMDLDGESLTVIDSSMESLYSTGDDNGTVDPGTPGEPETPTTQEQESSSMVWLAILIPIVVILLIGIPLILWKLKKNRAAKYQLKRLPLPQVETA